MGAAASSPTIASESTSVVPPLSAFAGAQCGGIDLGNFKSGQWERLKEGHGTYSILVVCDQKRSKPDRIAFSERFGKLELPIRANHLNIDYLALHVVSDLGKDGKPNPKAALDNPANFFWHTDGSYMQRPASTTLLYAIDIPPSGGDTLFANMHASYDALPAEMKQRIDRLRAVHSWEQLRYNSGSRAASAEEIAAAPPSPTRLYERTSRQGARACISVKPYVPHRRGARRRRADATQGTLGAHDKTPVHLPSPVGAGDIAIWDNRSLLHKTSADFDNGGSVRRLHRTVTQGGVPR